MRRRLNLRFLAILIGVLAVLISSGHFLRAFQVRRNAGKLLTQAERTKKDGHLDEAVKIYRRYLALKPTDGDALAEYGMTLDQLAKQPHDRIPVFFILEHALQLNGERDDVRRHQVDVAMAIERFKDAEDHLVKLMERSPNNGELEYLRGLCLERREKLEDNEKELGAVGYFKLAIEHSPKRIDSYVHLANLHRQDAKLHDVAKRQYGKKAVFGMVGGSALLLRVRCC